MKEIRANFIERIKRASAVSSFRFSVKEKIDFLPGHFLEIIFDEANRSNRALNKYLSFSASPTKEYIEITKKLSESIFSRKLQDLKPGDEALFRLPLGNCVFRDNYKQIGFLIGGIGITPAISIIEYIMDKGLDTDIRLFYSNRTDEDIAFKKELDYWQSVNQNIKLCYIVTDCQPKDTSCIYGTINQGLLRQRVCDLAKRIVFIFGPPKMVEAMDNLCLALDCAKENIRRESFIGY